MDYNLAINIPVFIFSLLASLFFCYFSIKLPCGLILTSFLLSTVSIIASSFPLTLFYRIFFDHNPTQDFAYINSVLDLPVLMPIIIIAPYIVTFLYLKYKNFYTMQALIYLVIPFTLSFQVTFFISMIAIVLYVGFLDSIIPITF